MQTTVNQISHKTIYSNKVINDMENSAYIDIIKQIMAEKGLSQQGFANIVGVNQTTVSQWLLGKKKPTYDCILSICTNFDITPNEFFGF